MCKPFIEIDYPCDNLWYEFYEERQGWVFPFTHIKRKTLNEEDLEDPKIRNVLEAMGIINVIVKEKLKGVPL